VYTITVFCGSYVAFSIFLCIQNVHNSSCPIYGDSVILQSGFQTIKNKKPKQKPKNNMVQPLTKQRHSRLSSARIQRPSSLVGFLLSVVSLWLILFLSLALSYAYTRSRLRPIQRYPQLPSPSVDLLWLHRPRWYLQR
jgi:hypothetical protein